MEQLKKLRTLPVSSLMTRDIVTIKGSQTVAEAIGMMKEHNITGLIVEPRGEGDAYGIITEKDIIEKVIDPGEDVHKDPWNTQVYMVMSKPCITIDQNLHIKYAIRLMHRVGVGRVPVVKNDELVGILTEGDILRAVENLDGSDDVAL